MSTVPTTSQIYRIVVFDGKIHMFSQARSSYVTHSHHSWNGGQWTEEVAFDKDARFDVVVLDDKLYAITNSVYLYREGQEWDEYLTAPAWCQETCVYDGELFIVTVDAIYMLMDEQWVYIGKSPMTVDDSLQMLEVGDELVLIGNTGHFGGVFDGL
jgi:hypothetical protein